MRQRARRSAFFGYVTLPANDTYQPCASAGSSSSGSEKQCRITVPSKRRRISAVSRAASRQWMTTGFSSSAASARWDSKSSTLVGRRCVSAEAVETRLPHRHGAGMAEQLPHLVEPAGLGAARLVRVDPERGHDALLPLGDGERAPTGVHAGADRDHPRDAGLARPRDRTRRIVERIEMRVRVGHAATSPRMRSSSSDTMRSGSSLTNSGFGSRSDCPAGSVLGSQRATQPVVVAREDRVRHRLLCDLAQLELARR